MKRLVRILRNTCLPGFLLLLFVPAIRSQAMQAQPNDRPYGNSNTPYPDNSGNRENPPYNSGNQNQYPDDQNYNQNYDQNSQNYNDQGENISFRTFYDQLSPYGQWVNTSEFGQVWIPDAGPDFQPYRTSGHWVYTDYGWTWVSSYRWGWAPFHYGRWSYADEFGWYWIPGYQWSPAWVAWRHSEEYYGWAPLSPGLSIGISMSWGNEIPARNWCFVRPNYISSPRINNYYVSVNQNTSIINNTTIINNSRYVDASRHTSYSAGPAPAEVSRYTGRSITAVPIQTMARPGAGGVRNNQLMLYRPPVNQVRTGNSRAGAGNAINAAPGGAQNPANQLPGRSSQQVPASIHSPEINAQKVETRRNSMQGPAIQEPQRRVQADQGKLPQRQVQSDQQQAQQRQIQEQRQQQDQQRRIQSDQQQDQQRQIQEQRSQQAQQRQIQEQRQQQDQQRRIQEQPQQRPVQPQQQAPRPVERNIIQAPRTAPAQQERRVEQR